AMMIDGNRRWARQLGLSSTADGYRAGAAKMREFLTWCDELGISVVSLYLLSVDNIRKRDSVEIAGLIEVIAELAENLSHQGDWRVKHVGRSDILPAELAQVLKDAQERTKSNSGLNVNLAVGYGGRNEIVDAMRSIIASHESSGG